MIHLSHTVQSLHLDLLQIAYGSVGTNAKYTPDTLHTNKDLFAMFQSIRDTTEVRRTCGLFFMLSEVGVCNADFRELFKNTHIAF